MTKHLWCWGDIISADLADKAVCAEQRRAAIKAEKAANDHAGKDPVAA